MNIAQSIYTREKGFRCSYGYDVALLRLKCLKEDVYEGVAPNIHAPDARSSSHICACKFSCTPGHHQLLALANEDGKLALQNTTAENKFDGPLDGTLAHNNAIFDIAWMPQELKLVTASGDRSAVLWDISDDGIEKVQTFQGNNGSVKSAVFRPMDKSVFATGTRDGTITIWDTRANHNGPPKPDNVITQAHFQKDKTSKISHSVTALAFQDDETLISCSAGDGIIKVWDLRKNYTAHRKENLAKYTMNYGGKSHTYNGFSSLMINPAGTTLYAKCVDKSIYAYNILTYTTNPTAEYYGNGNEVHSFYIKACLSPDGEYIISGSNDETAYIWSTRKPGLPVVKLSGHRDDITCLAWCHDKETKIVTCSDDFLHRIWKIRPDTDDTDEGTNIFGFAEMYSRQLDPIESKPTVKSTLQSDASITEDYKPILKPVLENVELSPVRVNNESRARQLLFSPSTEMSSPRSNYSSSNYESDDALAFSPTTGLPNYVVDGTAPHLLANSPQKKIKENVNWFEAMRKRKRVESIDKNESPKEKRSRTPKRPRSQRKLKFKKDDKNKEKVSVITDFINNLKRTANNDDKSTN